MSRPSSPQRSMLARIIVGGVIVFGLAALVLYFIAHSVLPRVWKLTSQENLKSLYCLMNIYGEQHRAYPAVKSKEHAGVRNLFPLYQAMADSQSATNGASLLGLFQVPGSHCIAFSANPTIDEFDKRHVSYSYNAGTAYDSSDRTMLMWERGVSNGVLLLDANDPADRPLFHDGVHVLFSNGTVIWVPADKDGRLATDVVSPGEWNAE